MLTDATGPDWPGGFDKIILNETDSTMAEVRRRRETLRAPTWILARQQTLAVGRRGRPWSSRSGNFAATLYLPLPSEPVAQAALRSFVASVALQDALGQIVARERLSLKWPNDVLLDGGKVAGILLESGGEQGLVTYLSIGIGVNLATLPEPEKLEETAFAPTALNGEVTPEAFLPYLAASYDRFETQFREFGFAPIRQLWLRSAARLGQEITAKTSRDVYQGRFEDVDEAGNLILRSSRGVQTIAAADIYF